MTLPTATIVNRILRAYCLNTPRIAEAFPSKDALRAYLKEHPKADPHNHWVETSQPGVDSSPLTGWKGLKKNVKDSVRSALSDLKSKGVRGIIKDELKSKASLLKGVWGLITRKPLSGEEKRRVTNQVASFVYGGVLGSVGGPVVSKLLGLVAGEVVDFFTDKFFNKKKSASDKSRLSIEDLLVETVRRFDLLVNKD